jgi:hypothetical protein
MNDVNWIIPNNKTRAKAHHDIYRSYFIHQSYFSVDDVDLTDGCKWFTQTEIGE